MADPKDILPKQIPLLSDIVETGEAPPRKARRRSHGRVPTEVPTTPDLFASDASGEPMTESHLVVRNLVRHYSEDILRGIRDELSALLQTLDDRKDDDSGGRSV